MSLKDEEPPASSFVSPRKTGWLYKHGGSGVSSHWRKRWFIADSNYLFYYKAPSDKKPVGLLCLQDYSSCSKAKDCKKPYSFVLERGDAQAITDHDNGKNYLLYADSEKEMVEWIKAMTEEMKGPIRQFSEKTRQKVEKVDQLALEEVSKTIGEGPKLVHLTTDRPKVKNRRPPMKKYTTYHEDDSKEDISEDDLPAVSRNNLDSSMRLQSSVKQKQPLLKSAEDGELVKEPSGSPVQGHKHPLLPKAGSKMAIKTPEDGEVAKVKLLPLLPKKSPLSENQSAPTEDESHRENSEGLLESNMQTTSKPKPLPPTPKKIDNAMSADSAIGVENTTMIEKTEELDKKTDTLLSIDNQADQPHGKQCTEASSTASRESAHTEKESVLELSSTSDDLPWCGSDESHTGSFVSASSSKSKPDEKNDIVGGTGNKPKPKPRKRAGKEQLAGGDQCEVLLPKEPIHTNSEAGPMAADTRTMVEPGVVQEHGNKLSEVMVSESVNQESSGSKEVIGILCVEQSADVKNTPPAVEPEVLTVSHSPESQTSQPTSNLPDHGKDCPGPTPAHEYNILALSHNGEVPTHNEEKVASSLQEPSINPEHIILEQPKTTLDASIITDNQEMNAERASLISESSVAPSTDPLERDSMGYTIIRKDGKSAVILDVSDSAVPKLSSTMVPTAAQQERAPRVREAYRMYETVDIMPTNKPQSPPVQPEEVSLALKQAKEVLRLAQAVRAEAEEMRKEAQRELELAKRDRYDAEILKKNATEILKMAKEKLQTPAPAINIL